MIKENRFKALFKKQLQTVKSWCPLGADTDTGGENKRLCCTSVQLFDWLVADILALSLPSETVTDEEAAAAPSHHRTAATPADSGPSSQGVGGRQEEEEEEREKHTHTHTDVRPDEDQRFKRPWNDPANTAERQKRPNRQTNKQTEGGREDSAGQRDAARERKRGWRGEVGGGRISLVCTGSHRGPFTNLNHVRSHQCRCQLLPLPTHTYGPVHTHVHTPRQQHEKDLHRSLCAHTHS